MKAPTVAATLAAVLAAGLLAAQLGALSASPPNDLGVRDGLLKPPSTTRNSVTSQAERHPGHPQRDYATIAPLPFKPGGTSASLAALDTALSEVPGLTPVTRAPDYRRLEARTRWLAFVDDVEFWADPSAGVIHVRSASRLGREDFGANRERVEAIRAAYARQP